MGNREPGGKKRREETTPNSKKAVKEGRVRRSRQPFPPSTSWRCFLIHPPFPSKALSTDTSREN
jgi:hypothetical protein